MKVSNMKSSRGNSIPNQLIIHTSEFELFQSYDSIIVKTTFEDGKRIVYLDEYYWNYSKNTAKYRNLFLGETTNETQQKIDKGIYKLIDLN